jgi:hypothetical protein
LSTRGLFWTALLFVSALLGLRNRTGGTANGVDGTAFCRAVHGTVRDPYDSRCPNKEVDPAVEGQPASASSSSLLPRGCFALSQLQNPIEVFGNDDMLLIIARSETELKKNLSSAVNLSTRSMDTSVCTMDNYHWSI